MYLLPIWMAASRRMRWDKEDNMGLRIARADFGAIQNRLQSTISNLAVSVENMSAANSRIRDVDVAEETAELTKNNILLQAGTSVLAQANSTAQTALSLLNRTFQ